jgi:hypothetical protein
MPQQDPRLAARDRDLGIRRISQFTWQAGPGDLGRIVSTGAGERCTAP